MTKTQLKSRIKREKKENIKPEEPWGRLDAAVARREQSAEAKQIATAEKQAAAVKKRVATIAKVAISEKIQSRSQSTVETKTANGKIWDGNGTARGRVAEEKAEGAGAQAASRRNEEN